MVSPLRQSQVSGPEDCTVGLSSKHVPVAIYVRCRMRAEVVGKKVGEVGTPAKGKGAVVRTAGVYVKRDISR
jgi:hypothetical protein